MTLQDQILYCLEKYPKSRDSDIALTIIIWQVYYPRGKMTKYQKNKLDKLWAEAIRLRDKRCQICSRENTLNTHHIVGRRNHSVRWDLENGITLCAGCHTLKQDSAHQNPLWFNNWLEEKKGKKFVDELRIRSQLINKPDYNAVKLYLENEIKKAGA